MEEVHLLKSHPMFNASDYHSLLQQLEQFFNRSTAPAPVTQPLAPTVLRDRLDLELPAVGKPLAELHSDIAAYLNVAVKTAHPAYFNQLWGGFNPAGFMGELLTSAANTSMYTYEVAPAATLIERTLVQKMGQLAGFSNPEGQFTTGGSNGNLMAMAIARHQNYPLAKQQGMGEAKLVAFVSEEAHYSFAKAAHLLGIGTAQLWKVPTDSHGKMSVAALEQLIAKAHAFGYRPFLVVGTAGTTVRGAYDPFEAIAAIARREGLWFHVDGAWGAGVLLSPTHRHLMQGVEQADSLVWDAHKMMGMTLMCSVLLVNQRGTLSNTFAAGDTGYLFHQDAAAETLDLGPSTMHCGRRADAVKLWLAWKHLGDRGWSALIDRYFALAAYAESLIAASDDLELVGPRQSLNLCFQYRGRHRDSNAITLAVRQALQEAGTALVNYAQVGDRTVFRLVTCNNQTRPEHLENFFSALVQKADELDQPA